MTTSGVLKSDQGWVIGERVRAALRDHAPRAAVLDGARAATFGELDELSQRIGAWLAAQPNPGQRVVVLADRGFFAYAGIMAAMRAGVTFVPLAPTDPAARLRTMMECVGACPVLCDDAGREALARLMDGQGVIAAATRLCGEPAGFGVPAHSAAPASETAGEPPAYILFTSGSTGKPKGVPISRANLDAFWKGFGPLVDVRPGERVSQNFRLTFDLSIGDLLMSWCTGAALVVSRDADRAMPAAFIERHEIDVWFSVPSVADVMRQSGQLTPRVPGDVARTPRMSLFCGERLLSASARAWRERFGGTLINLYGPTEATIACAYQAVDDDALAGEAVPIGRAMGDTVLALRPIEGEDGHELLLGGPQVFSGYLAHADGTSPPSPFDGTFYRSGDRAAYAGGAYRFLGRIDDQVKVRGHRIELGEIEAHLRAHGGVRDAVVVCLHKDDAARAELAAVIVAEAGATNLLGARLAARLPAHMMPSRFITVGALPRSANGKTDRAACARLAQA